MKKTLILALLTLALCGAFAHQTILDQKSVEYRTEKVGTSTTVTLTYNNVSKNLMVIATTDDDHYDEADAITLIRDTIKKFAEEKDFKHYRNYSDDIIRWRNGNVEYTRFVILYN